MSVNLTINGATYPYPSGTDVDWGDEATQAMQALAQYALYDVDLDTDGTLAADSDSKIPTQKAVKTYADTKVAKSLYDAHSILAATTDNTPAPLTVAEASIVGRLTGGNIDALTKGEVIGFLSGITTKNADYPITDTDGVSNLYVTTGNTTRTITLPTVADNAGRIIDIIKADSGTGYVTIDGEGAETINGVASITVENQYCGISVQCTGSAWIITKTIGECAIQTIGSAIELIYKKIFTGTTDADDTTTISHGITTPKSIKILATINDTTYDNTIAELNGSFYCLADATNILIGGVAAGYQSKTYVVEYCYYI